MKLHPWTVGLLAAGVITGPVAGLAEEASETVKTFVSTTTISGYVSTSAIWKFGNGNASLPGRLFDGPAKQDGFNLDIANVTIAKPLDESVWSAGYKVDLLFGPDANGPAVNSLATASAGPGFAVNDFAVKQAYVALNVPVGNGLDFKFGVWDTIIGYEVFEYARNAHYSRSYGYFLEPKVHTGVLATYRVSDVLSLAAGVANTSFPATINARSSVESAKTYMGAFALRAPESWGFFSGATLAGGIIDSARLQPAPAPGRNPDRVNYYIGGTMPLPVEGLLIGIAYDYQGNSSYDGPPANRSSYANATALYLSYQATENLTASVRADYATATGTPTGAGPGVPGTFYPTFPATDDDPNNKLFAVTGTLDYALFANVVSRVEFRWDTALTGERPFGAGNTAATGGDKNAFSLALNVIYQF